MYKRQVHTWLPDAHVEAPTAGSVILAGILLKMGGYGFIRFSLPMFPLASLHFQPLIFTMSVIAVIYTSPVSYTHLDVYKRQALNSERIFLISEAYVAIPITPFISTFLF